MVITTIFAVVKKKMGSTIQAVMLLSAVLINILVWLIEQLVHIDFEFLSISYIISELFLIILHVMVLEQERLIGTQLNTPIKSGNPSPCDTMDLTPYAEVSEQISPETFEEPEAPSPTEASALLKEQIEIYLAGLSNLTPTERHIYDLYVAKNTTKDIMAILNIKENTLKFHNKNIYGKLGVSSRKQLLEIHKQINFEQ